MSDDTLQLVGLYNTDRRDQIRAAVFDLESRLEKRAAAGAVDASKRLQETRARTDIEKSQVEKVTNPIMSKVIAPLTCSIVHVPGDIPRWRVVRSDGMQLMEVRFPCEFDLAEDEPAPRPKAFDTRVEAESFANLYASGVPLNQIPVAPAPSGVVSLTWAP
jgi:hypothetical protein